MVYQLKGNTDTHIHIHIHTNTHTHTYIHIHIHKCTHRLLASLGSQLALRSTLYTTMRQARSPCTSPFSCKFYPNDKTARPLFADLQCQLSIALFLCTVAKLRSTSGQNDLRPDRLCCCFSFVCPLNLLDLCSFHHLGDLPAYTWKWTALHPFFSRINYV
jgi:hypothetical protein